MKLLAIDPGSNKCGIALFDNGQLVDTITLTTSAATPLSRRISIASQVSLLFAKTDVAVSEEPLLMGRNNNGMQRLLGMFELGNPKINFIHPLTMKKVITGSGKAEKLDVALAAGEKLKTDREKEIMAEVIKREAFDEADAVAIGLVYLEQNK